MVSDGDVKSYKQIKDDLDALRLLVEKSELWVYKAKTADEKAAAQGKKDDDDEGGPAAAAKANSQDEEDKKEEEISKKVEMSPSSTIAPIMSPRSNGADKQASAIDLDIGPALEGAQKRNYEMIQKILQRMNRLCVQQQGFASTAGVKPRKHEQRLLRNMGVHSVLLDLLQIPYDQKEDIRMNDLMRLTHEFLQNFCLGNGQNQALLHKHIDLFLTPGVSTTHICCHYLIPSELTYFRPCSCWRLKRCAPSFKITPICATK